MKTNKLFYLLAILSFGMVISSCGDDEEGNEITITIEEPLDDETISDCGDVHIHVEITASDENHEVEIVLHPEGNTEDKIIDFDMHAHDQVITFEQEVDLCSYPAGTCFHLEVLACTDHDCEETETEDVEFCLQ